MQHTIAVCGLIKAGKASCCTGSRWLAVSEVPAGIIASCDARHSLVPLPGEFRISFGCVAPPRSSLLFPGSILLLLFIAFDLCVCSFRYITLRYGQPNTSRKIKKSLPSLIQETTDFEVRRGTTLVDVPRNVPSSMSTTLEIEAMHPITEVNRNNVRELIR
ncbi:hypothetical protein [Paenibacillus silvisoli]